MLERTPVKILVWLGIVLVLLWAMVMLGGATRLTHSGLSIVEWRPITGIIPPLNDVDWAIEFDKYKLSPEYLKINHGMAMANFKFIYMMEYLHRLLGRLIGIVFFIPFLIFRKHLPIFIQKKCWIIFGLGGLQGVMGWYMVKSGLVDNPNVSHYRLTAHLGLAFIIIAMMTHIMHSLLYKEKKYVMGIGYLNATIILMCITFVYGGFTAGLKAGLIYNTFPLMEGTYFPTDGLFLKPLWINFVENQATVQWTHRFFATLTFIFSLIFALKNIKSQLVVNFFLVIALQYVLGIATLLKMVPVGLGTIHQAWAVIVLIFAVYLKGALHDKKTG
jgi:cytochrome c oxidase assembly protein subunit 15